MKDFRDFWAFTNLEIVFGTVVLWLMVAAAAFLTVSLFNPGFNHVCG